MALLIMSIFAAYLSCAVIWLAGDVCMFWLSVFHVNNRII